MISLYIMINKGVKTMNQKLSLKNLAKVNRLLKFYNITNSERKLLVKRKNKIENKIKTEVKK